MKKLIVLSLLLLLIINIGSAAYEYPDTVSTDYTNEVSFTVSKDSGTNDGTLTAEVCGNTAHVSSFSTGTAPATTSYPTVVSFKIPHDAPCGLGKHKIQLTASSIDGTDTWNVGQVELNVEPKGDMDPHVSEYLYAVLGVKKDKCTFSNPLDPGTPTCEKREVLRHFFLSDDKHPEWTGEGFFNSNPDQYGEDNNILLKNPQHLGSGTGGWEAGIGNTTAQSLAGLIWIDSGYYTGCPTESPSACSVWAHPFVTTNKYNPGNLFSGAKSMSPLHKSGEFEPEGEIIFGNYPEYYQGTTGGVVPGDNNQVEEKFFVCRQGATMENGYTYDEVPQVVEANGQLYQCDLDQGDWNEVSECEDGLDNDGDGSADHHSVGLASGVEADPSCSSPSDPESGPLPDDCAEVYQNSEGEIVYRYSGGSPTCDQEEKLSNFQNDITGHNIDTFYCNLTSGTVVTEEFDNQDGDLTRANQFCSSQTLHSGQNIATEEVKAVEFLPKKELFTSMDGIRDGIPVSEIKPSGWQGQLYFGSDGWRTGMQTLHQAEEFYSGSNNAHDSSVWANKGMKNLQGYQTGAQSAFKDAWTTSNAGKSSTGDTGVSSPGFLGGFHGKCKGENSWSKGEEWGCIGDGIILEIFGNSPANYQGNNTALRLTEQQASKWEVYTGLSPTPSTSNKGNLEIRASCWHGNPEQRPSDSSKILYMSKKIQGGDTLLAGHVPDNSLSNNGVVDDERTVSCNYGFQQAIETLIDFPKLYYEGGNLEEGQNPSGVNYPVHVAEGSNENGVVSSTTVGVSVPDNFDFDEVAKNTQNPDSSEIFKQFPAGGGGGGGQTGTSLQNRNPFTVCQDFHGCP